MSESRSPWTFLSNHGHVLLCIAQDPDVRGRDIATRVGVTERAAQRIVADLVEGGYITRVRVGRRNRYSVHGEQPLRHPVESHRTVRELVDLVGPARSQGEDATGDHLDGAG
jgi:predicted transcriptional regulator